MIGQPKPVKHNRYKAAVEGRGNFEHVLRLHFERRSAPKMVKLLDGYV